MPPVISNMPTPPSVKRPKVWLAVLLNILLPPYGYFYAKSTQRFFYFYILIICLPVVYAGIFWMLPQATWGLPHICLIFLSKIGFQIFLIFDAQKCTKRNTEESGSYLRRSRTYWLLPVSIVLFFAGRSVATDFSRPFFGNLLALNAASFPNVMHGDLVAVSGVFDDASLKRGTQVVVSQIDESTRADIHVFRRILAIPGDEIRYRTEKLDDCKCYVTRFTVNGRDLKIQKEVIPNFIRENEYDYGMDVFREENADSSYLTGSDSTAIKPDEVSGDSDSRSRILGPEEYFLISDNRTYGEDSRSLGPVRREWIVGIYAYTILSFHVPRAYQPLLSNLWALLKHEKSSLRTERIAKRVE